MTLADIRLSAFADEISPDLDEQIAVLKQEGISLIELRSVWGTNVLSLSDAQLQLIKQTLEQHSMAVSAIGSPIGKVPIDNSFDEHLEQFERAIAIAKFMGTPYIRIFSFYPPSLHHASSQSAEEIPSIEVYREDVIQRLRTMAQRASEANIILLHENEKLIYGDTVDRCIDLFQSINSSSFRAVLDPANYLECKQVPYPQAYEAVKPWLSYIHVKDVNQDGELVVAGAGEARWPELLQQLRTDGYQGILALEPHLTTAGQYQGFSGPQLFQKASQSLQALLRRMDWAYS